MKRIQYLLCAFVVIPFAFLPSARAAIVTYSFAGTVTDPADDSGLGYVPSSIQPGTSFTGTVSFNNSAVASLGGDANNNFYRGTQLDLSVSITVDGQYQYKLSTPSSSDEIDLESNGFDLFKRGPSVNTSFAPNPPFSHLDLELQTDSDVLGTADVTLGQSPAASVSDAQTSGAGYYDISANLGSVQLVPEPGTAMLAIVALAGLMLMRRLMFDRVR